MLSSVSEAITASPQQDVAEDAAQPTGGPRRERRQGRSGEKTTRKRNGEERKKGDGSEQ